jgi:hypothetical protein
MILVSVVAALIGFVLAEASVRVDSMNIADRPQVSADVRPSFD